MFMNGSFKKPVYLVDSSGILIATSAMDHPFVQAGLEIGRTTYGSPTSSDQAIIPCTSVKLGPGDSRRSHTADEFIFIKEIEEGIEIYIKILEKVL